MNQIQAQLVCIENGEAVTTTLAIAEGCEVDHASIIKLVRNYANDLEEFGILDFKSENQTGNTGGIKRTSQTQTTLTPFGACPAVSPGRRDFLER